MESECLALNPGSTVFVLCNFGQLSFLIYKMEIIECTSYGNLEQRLREIQLCLIHSKSSPKVWGYCYCCYNSETGRIGKLG